MSDILDMLPPDATHHDAERFFTEAGWTPCGAGDWAIALRSPDGMMAARISPFDPTGPYTTALYRDASHTRQVPQLFAHRRLIGGGYLQVMERLNGKLGEGGDAAQILTDPQEPHRSSRTRKRSTRGC